MGGSHRHVAIGSKQINLLIETLEVWNTFMLRDIPLQRISVSYLQPTLWLWYPSTVNFVFRNALQPDKGLEMTCGGNAGGRETVSC
jgi:hypothetical protein